MRALGGFYSSAELTFVSWRRGSFFLGKILLNTRISWDFFLIGIPLIRVNRGIKDISFHGCSWRSSKAMLDLSCSLFPSASPFPSTYYSAWGFPSSSCICHHISRWGRWSKASLSHVFTCRWSWWAQWNHWLPCMQCVYKISSLVAPYSMALLALADGSWSVAFLSFIIYLLKIKSSLMTLWTAFIKC